MEEKINRLIADSIKQKVFPGAVVLIGDNSRIQFLKSYGTTKYEDKGSISVQPDFIYDLASVTKTFTYTAGLKLIEEGKISLETRLGEILEEFTDRERSEIKIWNLFTHTSGLSFKFSSFKDYPSKHLRKLILSRPPVYETGTEVLYDNINAMLMAEVITKVSGQKFVDYLREKVIKPLGLKSTTYKPVKKMLKRIVPTEDDSWRMRLVHGEVHDESAYALGGIAGHAGLFSTARDLWRFGAMWLNGGTFADKEILSKESTSLATTKQIEGPNGWMGLGWKINYPDFMDHAPDGTYGHAGFTGTSLVVCPAKNKIIILLSNRIYPKRTPPEPIFAVRSKLSEIVLR